MSWSPWVEAILYCAVLTALAWPLGHHLAATYEGRRTSLDPIARPLERACYRLCGIDASREMTATVYARTLLLFSALSLVPTYLILRFQDRLPLNPQHAAGLDPGLAWNTAVSFATTTDWQFYGGENALGDLSQMVALGWQNFVAAGIGACVAVAIVRAFARERATTIGNFWVDLTRSILYVLLPLSIVFALVLASQGVPQTLAAYATAHTPDGTVQQIVRGPIASQMAISFLGGNGGGFLGANALAPLENPNGVTNFVELLSMLLLPAAFVFAFGRMVGRRAEAWMLYATLGSLLVVAIACGQLAEAHGSAVTQSLGLVGANMEGKDVRFDDAGLSLAVATDSTVGAANVAYDSLTPLAGLVALVDMQLGEVSFGGVGSGLFGILLHVVLAVFLAGLMVGRTPEYLGKKIERREIVLTVLGILAFPIAILVPAAIACVVPGGLATLGNAGPHGFTEILYAFASTAASNGSAFAGLGVNTFYEVALGIAMLLGRYAVIVPVLALAGTLAAKPRNEPTRGTLQTARPTFGIFLLATIALVGALTFLPADALGPIAEHVLAAHGATF